MSTDASAGSLERLVRRVHCWWLYWSTRRKCRRAGTNDHVGLPYQIGTDRGNAIWWGMADGISDHTKATSVRNPPNAPAQPRREGGAE